MSKRSKTISYSPLLAYAVAVLAASAATLIRLALSSLIGETAVPFITFFPAVLFVAWYRGFWPAALCTLLSALAGDYFFIAPAASLRVPQVSDEITLATFVVVGIGIALLGYSLQRSVYTARKEAEYRKNTEAAEREQRQRLQTTLSSIGDAVISTDGEGRITFANRITLGLLKQTEAEVLGKPLDEVFRIVNEYTRATVESPVKKVLREGAIVGLANHTVLLCPDGREIPIDDSAAPIIDIDGKLRGTVLVFRDIAERRRAEETSRLLASIVESSDDAIISKDLNGNVTSWNSGAERIFGYRASEMLGRPISTIAAPDRADEMPVILERVKAGERIEHYETVRRAKTGTLVNISLTVSPVRDAAGRIIGASKIARDITERKRTEHLLRQSQEETRSARDWLQTTLTSIGDAVVATDVKGNITFLNPVAAALTGWTEQQAKGMPLDDVFVITNEETGAAVESPVTKALREGRRVGLANHTQLIAKNGSRIPIDDSAAPIRDADGRVTGVVLIFRDVSDRKETEKRLALLQDQVQLELSATRGLHELGTRLVRHKDLHALLTEILSAAKSITAADFGIIQLMDANGTLRIAVQHGFASEFLEFFDQVDREHVSVCGTALARGERVVVNDIETSAFFAATPVLTMWRDAGVRAVQSTPIIDRAGVIVGMLSTHYRKPAEPTERDLRLLDLLARQAAELIERLRAEDALRISEERLRASQQQLLSITDNMAAAVTRCSRDFRYVWASRGYAAWVGRRPEDIAGRSIIEVLGPQGFEDIRQYMERAIAGERVEYTAQVNFLGPGKRWIHAVYVPTYADAAVDGWIAVVADVTELINAQQQLEKANTRLAIANKDLERFAFVASHDLQEPLRMITAYSQLLMRRYPEGFDSDAAVFLDHVVEGTRRMRDLLADLLTYTRVGSSDDVIIETVDMNRILADVQQNLHALIAETGTIISSDRLPSLPVHPGHGTSLLQNLIANAIRYRSEQIPRIHVSVEEAEGRYRFAVSDNGIGIDPKYQMQIFEVFKRLHGGAIPGTGVGLAICKRVVERYGGRIWVESAEGQGATFFFTLPAAAMHAAGGSA